MRSHVGAVEEKMLQVLNVAVATSLQKGGKATEKQNEGGSRKTS